MENANMNFPKVVNVFIIGVFQVAMVLQVNNKHSITDMPDTQVLAKVYQLYMVEYQWASMLISQSQGVVDITVSANQTINNAAHTVFFQIYFFPSLHPSELHRLHGISFCTLYPRTAQRPMVRMVQMVKNGILRKAVLPFNIGSFATAS